MAAPCSRESHLELQAVEMTAPLTATCSVGACAAGGGAQGARAGRGGRGEILTFRFPDIRARVDRDADTLPPSTPYSVEEEVHDTAQGLSPCGAFNMVGGEILTFPDTPTTQGLSLWCISTYYIVAGADGGAVGRSRRAPASPARARARVPSRSLLPPTRNIADASHGRTPLVMRARLQAGGETIQLGNPYIPYDGQPHFFHSWPSGAERSFS